MTDPGPMGRPRRHADLVWTSFDRFGRYARVAELLTDEMDDGPIVDIGDRSGYLRRFLPSRDSVAFDLGIENDRFDDAVFGVADGTNLPLCDGAASAAVSCDVLEHVPAADRPAFLRELVRVARSRVIITAPFDTVGVAAMDSMAARYATVVNGAEQPQLTEHMERGLPDLAATVAAFADAGWDVRVEGEGNLFDWLGLMLLRLGSEGDETLRPLGDGLDILYNNLLSARSTTPPFYRHVVSAKPGRGVIDGLDEALHPATPDVDAVGAAFLSQVGLIDLVPRLNALDKTVSDIVAGHLINVVGRTDAQHRAVLEALERLERRIGEVDERSIRSSAGRWWHKARRTLRRSTPT